MPQANTNSRAQNRNGEQSARPAASYLPPQDIKAEQSTLGAMLIEAKAIDEALVLLDATDFYRPEHQQLFAAIFAVHRQGKPVDLITLQAELKARSQLEEVGGIEYLTALFDTVTTVANVEYHADLVAVKSRLRRQIDAAHQIIALATAPDANPDIVQREADMGLRRTERHSELLPSSSSDPGWPEPDSAMFYGLVGDIVRAIEPHTEADPVALLVQLLVAYGSCIGPGPHSLAEADKHGGNLFAVLVGVSAKGRKGSSWGHVRRLFNSVDSVWSTDRVQKGLSSGEGLVHAVRDALEKQEKNKKTGEMETVLVDAGIDDKRLLVMEGEFTSVLRQTQRDGNTLSPTLRNAWDTGSLQSLTKSTPAKATGAHISMIGHITKDELLKDLAQTETANGFGNRFLWVCVKRSKELSEGGDIDSVNLAPLIQRLHSAIVAARAVGTIKRDTEARAIWKSVYHDLSTGSPGLFGAVTSRAEAQVMRLALIYALLDEAETIRKEHLLAALAFWEYALASARYIFGDALGDTVADTILRSLRQNPNGLTRTQISNEFGRNMNRARLDQALGLLSQHGYICSEKEQTGGAPIERYKAVVTK